MRRGETRHAIGRYVRRRLAEECRTRGTAAKIARETGFTTAHLTNVQKSERGVGDDFAHAMAGYWGMTFAQLEEAALKDKASSRAEPDNARDALPKRTAAAALAREDGVYEGAIESVLAEQVSSQDAGRSTLWWADRMRLRQREMLDETNSPCWSYFLRLALVAKATCSSGHGDVMRRSPLRSTRDAARPDGALVEVLIVPGLHLSRRGGHAAKPTTGRGRRPELAAEPQRQEER